MTVPIDAIASLLAAPGAAPASGSGRAGQFMQLLSSGVDATSAKLNAADAAVQAFALDDNVPVHQVTFALEQARLSLELMIQVRDRLLEGYQDIMRMQL